MNFPADLSTSGSSSNEHPADFPPSTSPNDPAPAYPVNPPEIKYFYTPGANPAIPQQDMASNPALAHNLAAPYPLQHHPIPHLVTPEQKEVNPDSDTAKRTKARSRTPHLPAEKNAALRAAKIAADCPDPGRDAKDRFRCTAYQCNKSFQRRYNLKVHARKHTNETPYSCKEIGCGKKFKWRSSMSHHQKSHANRKAAARTSAVNHPRGPGAPGGLPVPVDPSAPTFHAVRIDHSYDTRSSEGTNNPRTVSSIRQEYPQVNMFPSSPVSSSNADPLGNATTAGNSGNVTQAQAPHVYALAQVVETQRQRDTYPLYGASLVHPQKVIHHIAPQKAYAEAKKEDIAHYHFEHNNADVPFEELEYNNDQIPGEALDSFIHNVFMSANPNGNSGVE